MDRVSSDHPSIDTVAATLRTWGPTDRPEVRLPTEATDILPDGAVVRLVLDGDEFYCRPAVRDGTTVVRGAYDTPELARDSGGARNRLADWVEARDLAPGRTVDLDVVDAAFRYGLRGPGETATYPNGGSPSDTLASIAERVDGGDDI